jgi:hypothetical protein
VFLIAQGKAEALMKGSLHTDELMGAGGPARDGPAHRPPDQSLLRARRADLTRTR